MIINEGELIIGVWAEEAKGPGWANPLYWAVVRERKGALRLESIQPSEQPSEMILLHGISARLSQALLNIIYRKLKKEKKDE